jgi:hypothetical protein
MKSVRKGLQIVSHYDPSKAYNGYTLFSPAGGTDVWLMDMTGRLVHRWEMPMRAGAYGELLPNGNLLYAGKIMTGPLTDLGGFGGVLYEVDWDGHAKWTYEDPYLHHAFYRMDNGNTMVLRWVAIPDDIAEKIKGGIPGTERDGIIWGDSFHEVTPDGEVVWEWLAHEHLDPEVDILCPLCVRKEWAHANSCVVLPNGDVMCAFRRTDMVIIVDKSTGAVKWRYGPGVLGHPHDPTMLDNGNILVFDNGFHRIAASLKHWGSFSRVLEVEPDTKEIVWEYIDTTDHFHAAYISGCQRLPNGNTLICEGTKGRFFEVTSDGEIVWDCISPFYYNMEAGSMTYTNQLFRAYRYGPDYEGLKGKTLDSDRFDWVWMLQDKGKSGTAQVYPPLDEEKTVHDRTKPLAY